ncbi:hypothetical protein MMC30_009443, partial [Trapelia coarctata]|nr:hypothetical protein [Trapelia coarctata]
SLPRPPLRTVKPAEYYAAKGRRKNERPDLRGVLAAASRAKLKRMEEKWKQFCDRIGKDLSDYFAGATGESIAAFLEWYLDQNDIKRLICLYNAFKMLQMLYRYEIGHSINKTIGEEVKRSIKSEFKRSYNLTVGTPYKPVIKVADLFALVHFLCNNDAYRYSHERDRVQLVLFLLLSVYILSRPDALVESSADGIKGSGNGLRYRDVKLTLIPNPVAGKIDILVLKITLLLTKGKRYSKKPIIYVLYERDDNLALCPVLHFLAVTFADQAFTAFNFISPEALYQIKVEEPRHTIELKWYPQKKDMCIFRRAKKGFAGISGATEAIRNQVMGHARGNIFKKYISQTVKYDV